MLEHAERVLTGVCAGDHIEHGEPDIVADEHYDYDLHEHRELFGYGAFVGESAEREADIERQYRNDDLRHDGKHDLLKFIEHTGDELRLVPCSRETHHDGEYQSAHDGHDLRYLEFKHDIREFQQPLDLGHY